MPYDLGWNYKESVWAPTKKDNGSSWPFWNLIEQVVKDDIIFHLHYADNQAKFEGYSVVLEDSYIINDLPTTKKHGWDFAKEYYKAELKNFNKLPFPVDLTDFFQENDQFLRKYFLENKNKKANKKRLFYVIQNNRLQCLNGAYFSEFEEKLSKLLISTFENSKHLSRINQDVATGEFFKNLKQRIGHQKFSDNVKKNFNYECCFPKCNVKGRGFLVSGHIDRWADNENLRGNVGNGLCLCLLHDKAFEKGFFTLDENFLIRILKEKFQGYEWLYNNLYESENLEIKPRLNNPSIEAIKAHWKRVGYINFNQVYFL